MPFKFKCEECREEITPYKITSKVIDGEWRTMESWCDKCEKWMTDLTKNKGFGTPLMRGGKAVSLKNRAQPSGRIGDSE